MAVSEIESTATETNLISESTNPQPRRRGRPPKSVSERAPKRKPPVETREEEPEEDDAQNDAEAAHNSAVQQVNQAAHAAEDEAQRQASAQHQDVFLWLDNLSDEMWSRLMVYVYREEPRWQADTTGGQKHYILKFAQRFGQDDLMRLHGSGHYQLQTTMARTNGTGSSRLRSDKVRIINPNYPPNMPLSDAWTKNPINAKWFWAIPILEAREREARINGATGPLSTAPTPTPTVTNGNAAPTAQPPEDSAGLVDLARRSQDQLMALTDPTRQLATLKTLMEISRPPSDNTQGLILEFMRDQMREQRETINQMRAQQQPAPQNPIELFTSAVPQLIEVARMMGFTRKTEETPYDPWASFLEKVVDAAPTLAELIVTGRREQPTIIDTRAEPAGEEQPQPQPQQPQQQPDQPTEQQKAIMNRLEPLIQGAIPIMIQAIRANNPQQLATWIIAEHGRQNFNLLRDFTGAEKLAEMATTHELLKTQMPDLQTTTRFFERVLELGSV